MIKQGLASTHITSVLEPRHVHRTDLKRPEDLTLVHCAVGRQLLWDVTVFDYLFPSRISAGLFCNTKTAAVKAKDRKSDKYRDLVFFINQ